MSQTHTVSVENGTVLTKRYVSWSRGEPRHEWAALERLTATTQDLVPIPLAADLEANPPWISMTVVPGQPLGGSLSAAELDGLEVALREMWSVPADGLPALSPAADLSRIGAAVAEWRGAGVVAEAHDRAAVWLAGPHARELASAGAPAVIGHGDPNLTNYLWDGSRVRIVDFEDAGRSEAALELGKLVEHLAGRQTDWTEFVSRFEVDRRRFAAARCLWATFWLTLLRPGGRSAERNPPGTAERQAERLIGLLEAP